MARERAVLSYAIAGGGGGVRGMGARTLYGNNCGSGYPYSLGGPGAALFVVPAQTSEISRCAADRESENLILCTKLYAMCRHQRTPGQVRSFALSPNLVLFVSE